MLRQEECVTLNSGESIGDPRDGSLWKDAVARHMTVRIIEGKKQQGCGTICTFLIIGKHAELKALLAAHESEERNIMMLPEEIEEINELLKQVVPSVQNAGDDGGDANGKIVCGVWSSFSKADIDLAQEMLDKIGYETSREQDYDEDDDGEDKMLYMLLVSHKIDA